MLRTIAAFDRIGEENAFAVLARANALAAQGRDIINLGIGQPDFRTPDFIVEAAVKNFNDNHDKLVPEYPFFPDPIPEPHASWFTKFRGQLGDAQGVESADVGRRVLADVGMIESDRATDE